MVTVVKLVVTQARVTVLTVLRQITGLVSVWPNVTSTFRSDRCLFKRDSGSSAESLALSVGSQADRPDGHRDRDGRPLDSHGITVRSVSISGDAAVARRVRDSLTDRTPNRISGPGPSAAGPE